VAGALRVIDAPLLTLDDGSGRGLVRLLDFDPAVQPPFHLGEVVNVTGTVATRDVGGWEIVASAEGIMRASTLSLPMSSPAPSATPTASPAPSADWVVDPATAGGPSDGRDDGLGRLQFAALVGLVLAGAATLVGGLAVRTSRRRTTPLGHPDGADGGPSTHQPA
jgi:hypothetical protein